MKLRCHVMWLISTLRSCTAPQASMWILGPARLLCCGCLLRMGHLVSKDHIISAILGRCRSHRRFLNPMRR
jgi:hypothetical protein